jgi:hypothetical protein
VSVFHTLIIGADFYFDNRLPSGGRYESLGGCVGDARLVEAMVEQRFQGHEKTSLAPPIRLLASNKGGKRPPEDEALWPTAENIRAAFAALIERVQPGDQVYIHYSGHGGRVLTIYPDLKGGGGVDEALVPIDIGGDALGSGTVPGRYIRDVELIGHLDKLVKKGGAGAPVTVTFTLDSCHSGGALRGTEIALRCATGGPSSLDTTQMSEAEAAAVRSNEAAEVYARTRSAMGGAPVHARWLPNAGDYVLLAACRDTESAIEAASGGAPRGGVMTAAFLEALRTLGEEQSWKTVYDHVLARVNSRFPSQTPQLLGQLDREVFGVRLRPLPPSVPVLAVDAAQRRVKVAVGLAMAVPRGAELGIYRPGTPDFSRDDAQVAIATVAEANATDSWATIEASDDVSEIVPGAPSILLSLPIRRKVELLHRDDLPAGIEASQRAALDAVATAISQRGRGFLEIRTGAQTPNYQVVVGPEGEYVICDATGRPFEYMSPAIHVDEHDGADRVVDRLLSLCRFHTACEMTSPPSQLDGQVTVELLRPPPDWSEGESTACKGTTPLSPIGDSYEVTSGEVVFIRVTNRSSADINVAALDLQCDWGIALIAPDKSRADAPYAVLGKGKAESFPVRVFVPDGFPDTPDVWKVFAAVGHVDFKWLEQPAIHEPPRGKAHEKGVVRGEKGSLAKLFAMLDAPRNVTRHAAPVSSPNAPWTVRHFRILVRRGAP